MTDKARIICHNPQQSHKALTDIIWPFVKNHTFSGVKIVVEAKRETRSLDQNAKFHALLEDIAKSGFKWAGKPRTAAEWKVLLVSGHAMATKEGMEVVSGLEGEFVNIRESTATMSKKRGASLIEYTQAFCATNGIRLTAHE
jgi:hypothetical protein